MQFSVVTLFPELINAITYGGVVAKAFERDLISLSFVNPRDYATDVHRSVDDRPYGGGPGMVMKADCLLKAIRAARQQNQAKVVYLSPQGVPLTQAKVAEFAQQPSLILLCGRYEGIDERVIELEVDEECSIGDYVLSGGELGAMVVIDAVTRLLPNVLGHHLSADQDSFSAGILDCPHYTRPDVIEGLSVPEVLTSGNHAEIDRWRKKQALGRTWERRADLLNVELLTPVEKKLLALYIEDSKVSSEVVS